MAGATMHLKGWRETDRALGKINRDAQKRVRGALLEAARPVSETAKGKLSRFQGAAINKISPRARVGVITVEDRARKVTGLRPDFGSLIMTRGLEPALDEHEDDVRREVEKALDRLGREAGF